MIGSGACTSREVVVVIVFVTSGAGASRVAECWLTIGASGTSWTVVVVELEEDFDDFEVRDELEELKLPKPSDDSLRERDSEW